MLSKIKSKVTLNRDYILASLFILFLLVLGFLLGHMSGRIVELNNMYETVQEQSEILEEYKETNEELVNMVRTLESEKEALKAELEYKNRYEEYEYALNNEPYNLNKDDIDLIKKYSRYKMVRRYSEYETDGPQTVDPHVVIAILHRESDFVAKAVNGNARGMGQVKISTGQYMRDIWNQKDDVNSETLLNRSLNIKYTTLFLNYLYNKYDGNYYEMISHYSGSASDKTLKIYLSKIKVFLERERNMSLDELLGGWLNVVFNL